MANKATKATKARKASSRKSAPPTPRQPEVKPESNGKLEHPAPVNQVSAPPAPEAPKPAYQPKGTMHNTMVLKSKAQFIVAATPLRIELNGALIQAEPKEFSTGSVGWYCNGKITVELGQELLPIRGSIAGNPVSIGVKEFASGKWGWFHNGKVSVQLSDGSIVMVQVGANLTIVHSEQGVNYNGIVQVQCGINLTVVGSKELPATEVAAVA